MRSVSASTVLIAAATAKTSVAGPTSISCKSCSAPEFKVGYPKTSSFQSVKMVKPDLQIAWLWILCVIVRLECDPSRPYCCYCLSPSILALRLPARMSLSCFRRTLVGHSLFLGRTRHNSNVMTPAWSMSAFVAAGISGRKSM